MLRLLPVGASFHRVGFLPPLEFYAFSRRTEMTIRFHYPTWEWVHEELLDSPC